MQDCSISIANTLKIMQCCTKALIYWTVICLERNATLRDLKLSPRTPELIPLISIVNWVKITGKYFKIIQLTLLSSQSSLHKTDGLVQDCSNSSALALELLQSCTKPPK